MVTLRVKVVAVLLVLGLALALSPSSLQAHSSPVASLPAINDVLTEDPTILQVTFGIELDPEGEHSVELLTKEGELVGVGATTQIDDFTLEAPVVAPLPGPGAYVVRYLAYELEEGTENFTFSGFQFFREDPPQESSNVILFVLLGALGVLVLAFAGWMVSKRR